MYINHEIQYINNTNEEKDAFFCNICKYSLITFNDFISNNRHNCCHECFLNFVECRKEDWDNGWRPDKEVLHKYLKERKQLLEKIIKI